MTSEEQPRFQRTRDALSGTGTEGAGPAPGSLSAAAERIRQMLVTAEAVSEDIRREAVVEAERYLAERRREADQVVAARREQLQRALETLRTEGREITERLAAVTAALERALADPPGSDPVAPAPAPEPSPEPNAAPSAEAVAPAAGEPEPGREPRPSTPSTAHTRQRALIRATQLAVQGVKRAEVEQTLEREFELADSAAIVDEILGSD